MVHIQAGQGWAKSFPLPRRLAAAVRLPPGLPGPPTILPPAESRMAGPSQHGPTVAGGAGLTSQLLRARSNALSTCASAGVSATRLASG